MQNVKQLEDVALAGIPRAIVVRVLLTRIEDEGTVVEAVGDTVPLGVGDVVPPGAAVKAVRNAVAIGVEAIRDVGAGVRAVWHAIVVSVGSVVLPWTAVEAIDKPIAVAVGRVEPEGDRATRRRVHPPDGDQQRNAPREPNGQRPITGRAVVLRAPDTTRRGGASEDPERVPP